MVVRGVVFVVAGVLTAVPAFAQEPVRSRVPGTPRAQIWINGEEVDPMGWVANRRARLGVTLDMRASENDSIGATISSVTPGGPAAKAGLRSGDIITKIDGKALVRGERERAESKSDADEDQVDQSARVCGSSNWCPSWSPATPSQSGTVAARKPGLPRSPSPKSEPWQPAVSVTATSI